MTLCNINEVQQGGDRADATRQWYEQTQNYDNHWWDDDQSQPNLQQAQVGRGPSSSQYTAPLIHIAASRVASASNAVNEQPDE